MGHTLADAIDPEVAAQLAARAADDDRWTEWKAAPEAPAIQYKVVPVVQQKVLDEVNGVVQTLVSVTGMVDRVKDVIEPGCYAKTLVTRTPKGVWHHDWTTPVSKTEQIDELLPGDERLPKQTKDGAQWPAGAGALLVTTRFNLETTRGKDAYSDVKFFGDEQEWSIGYQVPVGGARVDKKTGFRHIHAIDLYEYSPVLFGAMPEAVTQSVKSAQTAIAAVHATEAAPEVEVAQPDEAAEQVADDVRADPALPDEVEVSPSTPERVPVEQQLTDLTEDEVARLFELAQADVDAELASVEARIQAALPGVDVTKALQAWLAVTEAIAESKAVKAPAKAPPAQPAAAGGKFSEQAHPREAAGSPGGGKFKPGSGGPAAVSKAPNHPRVVAGKERHEVVAGDTLSAIAAKRGVDWHDVWELNKDALNADAVRHGHPDANGGDLIFPGVKLVLPHVPASTPAKPAATPASSSVRHGSKDGEPEDLEEKRSAATASVRAHLTGGAQLARYWSHGEGAAKVGWGTPGDFDRCVVEVGKYMTKDRAKGYCNLRHHDALGIYPSQHKDVYAGSASLPPAEVGQVADAAKCPACGGVMAMVDGAMTCQACGYVAPDAAAAAQVDPGAEVGAVKSDLTADWMAAQLLGLELEEKSVLRPTGHGGRLWQGAPSVGGHGGNGPLPSVGSGAGGVDHAAELRKLLGDVSPAAGVSEADHAAVMAKVKHHLDALAAQSSGTDLPGAASQRQSHANLARASAAKPGETAIERMDRERAAAVAARRAADGPTPSPSDASRAPGYVPPPGPKLTGPEQHGSGSGASHDKLLAAGYEMMGEPSAADGTSYMMRGDGDSQRMIVARPEGYYEYFDGDQIAGDGTLEEMMARYAKDQASNAAPASHAAFQQGHDARLAESGGNHLYAATGTLPPSAEGARGPSIAFDKNGEAPGSNVPAHIVDELGGGRYTASDMGLHKPDENWPVPAGAPATSLIVTTMGDEVGVYDPVSGRAWASRGDGTLGAEVSKPKSGSKSLLSPEEMSAYLSIGL